MAPSSFKKSTVATTVIVATAAAVAAAVGSIKITTAGSSYKTV